MAARAQGVDTVNQIVRRQIENLRNVAPLALAMQAWHRDEDEVTRREIERQVQGIMDTIGKRCPTPFGPGQALELLGALIAFEEGWKMPPGYRDRFMKHWQAAETRILEDWRG